MAQKQNKKFKSYLDRKLKEVKTDRFVIDLNMPTEYPPIEARPTEEGGVRDRFFAAKAELPDEITVVRPFCTDGFEKSNANTVYVAPDGCDCGDGTDKENPLATVEAALEKMKGKGGGKIVFRGGEYDFSKAVVITDEYSGTESSPLILTAEEGETPLISASQKIRAGAFAPLTDEAMLARLPECSRGKVLVADLKAEGITDYGTICRGGTELLVNSIKQPLCRYPNEGEKQIEMEDKIVCTGSDSEPWELGITDERFKNWKQTGEIYIYGALAYEWERYYTRIGSFDAEKMTMKGAGRYESSNRAIRFAGGNDYYFINVFEELDVPGEWYLDRESGKLYIYPPEGIDFSSADIRLINGARDIFVCTGAKNIIFDRLDLGRCSGCAVRVTDCRQVLIQRCHFIGTCPDSTGYDCAAAIIIGGFRNGLIASRIEHFLALAAIIRGGDRLNLIPSNNFLQNNIIVNPHCRFGTAAGGCGNIVSHNYYRDTTMLDGGHNEGIAEYNVVEGGDTETHDTGMIYIGGGGCSACASHYRYNYFFDFCRGDYGVYFDDLSRGYYAYGNIVVGNGYNHEDGSWVSGGRSYNVHNGGEHCFFNNISIDAGYFAFGGDVTYWLFDNHWNSLYPGIYQTSLGYRTEKYFGRNPTYRDYCKALDEYEEARKQPGYVVKSSPAECRLRKPWCNNYENNVIVRAARPFKLDNGEETATCLDTNYITEDDPGFVDFDGRDYRIRPDAPLFDKIPDFVPPPFEKMGPVDDFADED